MVERATVAAVTAWAEGLEELHGRIAPRFAPAEPRQRALAYLRGLLHPVQRKNGWQLAEQAGERAPDAMQRLLDAATWDADTVRDDLRASVVQDIGTAEGVLVVDQTGFLKKGPRSAGVQRQYSGTARRIEHCQIGVLLGHASPHEHALLDRQLYLPREWLAHRAPCRQAGIPAEVPFRTRPQLARAMLQRAVAAGVPFRSVTADEVYGGHVRPRVWLEERDIPHVLATRRTDALWVNTDRRPHQIAAEAIAVQIPARAWRHQSAGRGSQGPPVYAWAPCPIRPWSDPERGYWLLVRRSLRDPTQRASSVCYGPRSPTLGELVRVAGVRWTIQQGFERAKGAVGLHHYQVPRFNAWYRPITLALLAYASLEVTRQHATLANAPDPST